MLGSQSLRRTGRRGLWEFFAFAIYSQGFAHSSSLKIASTVALPSFGRPGAHLTCDSYHTYDSRLETRTFEDCTLFYVTFGRTKDAINSCTWAMLSVMLSS